MYYIYSRRLSHSQLNASFMRSQKIEIKAIDVMLMFGCFCSTHEAIHFLRDYSFQPPVVSYPFGKKEARVIITPSVQHVQVVHMDYNNDGISRLREGCGLWGVCVWGGTWHNGWMLSSIKMVFWLLLGNTLVQS